MFRDAKEELERLERELLEDTTEEETEEEEYEEDDGSMPEDAPEYYRNFSNDYRAYNTDRTDVDLEEYSREVEKPKERGVMVLLAVMAVLMAAIACVFTCLLLKLRGVL